MAEESHVDIERVLALPPASALRGPLRELLESAARARPHARLDGTTGELADTPEAL